MIILIESLIGIALFTIIMVIFTAKDPLTSVGDYPPAIRKKCIELGLITERKQRFTRADLIRKGIRFTRADLIRKGIAMAVFVFIFALVLKHFNRADTFWQGFIESYLIWLIIDWYDALILDCIWFCHSRKVRIPGTEEMKEYKDYRFHIKQSCIGMLLGLPACFAVGGLTVIL